MAHGGVEWRLSKWCEILIAPLLVPATLFHLLAEPSIALLETKFDQLEDRLLVDSQVAHTNQMEMLSLCDTSRKI